MTPQTAIYEGSVAHRRRTPRPNAFRYPLFLVYLDLAELPSSFAGLWLWSADRINLAWFRRRDHLGDPDVPLEDAVRDLVQERTGVCPDGAIRLLTHLRYFGFAMNPVSFYYCFNPGGQLDFIVAEVNNTPWGEQHCYVLDLRAEASSGPRKEVFEVRNTKAFHVSPFLKMDFVYHWRLMVPDTAVQVDIANHRSDEPEAPPVFEASLRLERREWRAATRAWVLLRYPFMTLQVWALIYWQALRLWWMGVAYVPHPRFAGEAGSRDSRE